MDPNVDPAKATTERKSPPPALGKFLSVIGALLLVKGLLSIPNASDDMARVGLAIYFVLGGALLTTGLMLLRAHRRKHPPTAPGPTDGAEPRG